MEVEEGWVRQGGRVEGEKADFIGKEARGVGEGGGVFRSHDGTVSDGRCKELGVMKSGRGTAVWGNASGRQLCEPQLSLSAPSPPRRAELSPPGDNYHLETVA